MCYQTWAVIKPWLHYCYESLFHFHHKVLAVCRSESLFNWHIPVIHLLIELVRMFNCNLTLFIAFIYTYIIVIFWCLNICTWTFIRIAACWINCFCNTFNLSHFWEKRDIQQKKTTRAETDSVNLEVISLCKSDVAHKNGPGPECKIAVDYRNAVRTHFWGGFLTRTLSNALFSENICYYCNKLH